MKINIKSWDDVGKYLIELASAESTFAKKEAQMNEKIAKIKEQFESDTLELRANIDTLRANIEMFALKNKSEFDNVRTKSFTGGTVGFRTHPPKIVQLSKKYSVKTSVELLKKLFGDIYIRLKEEINKDQLLVDLAQNKINDTNLAAVGLRVEKDETLFIDPDYTTVTNGTA